MGVLKGRRHTDRGRAFPVEGGMRAVVLCVCSFAQSCPTLCGPKGIFVCQASLSMRFSRQEYWSGLPCPPPGDLSNPKIELAFPASLALQLDSSPTEPRGRP